MKEIRILCIIVELNINRIMNFLEYVLIRHRKPGHDYGNLDIQVNLLTIDVILETKSSYVKIVLDDYHLSKCANSNYSANNWLKVPFLYKRHFLQIDDFNQEKNNKNRLEGFRKAKMNCSFTSIILPIGPIFVWFGSFCKW